MKIAWVPILALLMVTGWACSTGCRPVAVSGVNSSKSRTVRVDIVTAVPTTMERITTQPATVHAHFKTHVFAKVAGYLTDLNVDIGTSVKKGDVLARISIPEMARQREVQLATIRQMKANERRATAELAVSKASELSYQAKRDQAVAEVAKADAGLSAARVELDRVTALVKKQAVAERLQDESQKKYEAAFAEKTASQAAVMAAKAEVTLAQAQVDAENADLDVAKAATEVTQRELEKLDELIKYSEVIAPFDGVVTQRNVEPGDLVRNAQTGSSNEGQPLFVVSQYDKVRVRVYVPERDAPEATLGDSVRITLQALPGEVFTAEISRVAGVMDERTRTMLVEIDLDNAEGRIRPGMFGQAAITLVPPGSGLTLPVNAVHFDAEGNGYVYLADTSNKVAIVEIQTGLDDGTQIEIIDGLTGSDRVIGPLLHRLKTGQTVDVN